jgi:hypothetical protein
MGWFECMFFFGVCNAIVFVSFTFLFFIVQRDVIWLLKKKVRAAEFLCALTWRRL